MSWTERMIQSKGDILCYFAMIQKVVPQSICDYGLFLCRCGSTSRGIGGYTIAKNIQLSGVDLYPEYTPEIYKVIYDQLMNVDEVKGKSFDLGMMLRLSECVPAVDNGYIERAIASCKWLLTDEKSYQYFQAFDDDVTLGELNLEEEKYYIIKGRMG